MVNGLKYSTTIKSRDYMYLYLKKAVSLYISGISEVELKERATKENLFQVNSESRKKEIAATVIQRIHLLDPYLMEAMIDSDLESSKVIALYTVIKTDRLFFEFMNEVFKDKVLFGDMVLMDKDFNLFFETKAKQSEVIAKWKDYTFYKLQQVYIRILFEAGLLKNKKGDREILLPILDPEIKSHIENKGDTIYLQAMGVK
ncbi:DUF1819 family protein [Alkalihalobacterium alkalinitrilicum]|uniref:DUF1819 family protein n=1 Tax=Alkalihalobacterium alkalinitrilicum TaxID=427920 RepID=UPI000994F51D|nr:DUF1819 family protein [Alkalihalobacterium alkalinitrilicum]